MNLLDELFFALNLRQGAYATYDRYYRGQQAMGFISAESQRAIGNRLAHLVVNVPRILVNSLAERCRIIGFDPDASIWDDFIANDLDQQAGIVHRTALLYGQSFVIVWADADGNPTVSVESPLNVQVLTDPATREITAGIKRWSDRAKGETHAMVYLPDRIEHWRADTARADASGAFALIETLPNPLGVVPVVRFLNTDLVNDAGHWNTDFWGYGHSEIQGVMGLTDALCKVSSDALIASEYLAKPRRWATGVELVEIPKMDENNQPVLDGNGEQVMETINPFPDTDRFMLAADPESKFGQLSGSSLDGYQNLADLTLGLISAVSSLPPHYLGITHANPTSADALRASEAGLTSKAADKQSAFGRSWETVGKLMKAVRTGQAVADIKCRVVWCDPSTRSEAQAADAVVKLYQAGLLSKSGSLRRLGYSEDEIAAEATARASEEQNETPMGQFYGNQIRTGIAEADAQMASNKAQGY
ncbi:phage portal protein [Mycolicibacterium sp.]|uniref:phage portal protein n=1 Tax=Mycolicibacterium sp. TaxID=2320850 RepID=UPI0025E4619B|nr:phage portal protein [Mycolicibacterium sp.]